MTLVKNLVKLGYPLVIDLFPPKDSYCFPVVSSCVSIAWLDFPLVGARRLWGLHIQVPKWKVVGTQVHSKIKIWVHNSNIPTVSSSPGASYLYFFWLLGVVLDLERAASFCTLFWGHLLHPWLSHKRLIHSGVESLDRYLWSKRKRGVRCCQECLLFFSGWYLITLVLTVRSWSNWRLILRAWGPFLRPSKLR